MYLTYLDILLIILLCLLITVFGILIYNFFLLPERTTIINQGSLSEDIKLNLKRINEFLDAVIIENTGE
jgi:hypothetical protein